MTELDLLREVAKMARAIADGKKDHKHPKAPKPCPNCQSCRLQASLDNLDRFYQDPATQSITQPEN